MFRVLRAWLRVDLANGCKDGPEEVVKALSRVIRQVAQREVDNSVLPTAIPAAVGC